MSGGNPLRSITAVAALSLLALASFGTVLTFEIPVTPDEALAHAEEVSDPGDVFVWKCPTSDGSSYTLERLELEIPSHDKSDILRVPTVFVPVPILLVDSEDPSVKQVADHILSKTEGYSDYLKITAALYFVQSSIRYTSDQELYGYHEFWAAPCETLRLHKGDCEDTSVLLMSILGAMGYDCVLLDYDGHEAVGVRQGDQPSLDYLYCETAMDDILKPGFGDWNGEPVVYVPGDTFVLNEAANGFLAAYRQIIQRVAGT